MGGGVLDLSQGILGSGILSADPSTVGGITDGTGSTAAGAPDLTAADASTLTAPVTPGYIENSPPLVQPPDMGQALRAAAAGVAAANQAGQGYSGWLSGGLDAYSKNLETQRQRANDQRRQNLTDFSLVQAIQQRQQAQTLMTKKVQALQRLKDINPALADQIDIDPEGVSAAMTQALVPHFEKLTPGDTVVKIQGQTATPVYDPYAITPPGGAASSISPALDAGGSVPDAPNASDPGMTLPGSAAVPGGVTVNPDGSMAPASANPAVDPVAAAGVPPALQAEVREMLNGKAPPRLMSNPGLGPILEAMAQKVDPTFSLTQMDVRGKTADDFSSDGNSGVLLTRTAAAAGQLAQAQKHFDEMHSYDAKGRNIITKAISDLSTGTTAGNYLLNKGVQAGSDSPRKTALNQFRNTIGIAAPDVAAVATGSNAPAQSAIDDVNAQYQDDQTPDAMHGVFTSSAKMLASKAENQIQAYKRVFGGKVPPGLPLFNPQTIQDFKELGVDITPLLKPTGATASHSVPNAPPADDSLPADPGASVGMRAAGPALSPKGGATEKPPIAGARMAPDGNWYVKDAQGKFHKWVE